MHPIELHPPLPEAELDRYQVAVEKALTYAGWGLWADGRATLVDGLRQVLLRREEREEPWATELVWWWVRAIQRWDQRREGWIAGLHFPKRSPSPE